MKIGIIGLPFSGKTTLFNALTGGRARTGGYGGAQVHIGVAEVADPRVDALSRIFAPRKTVYATVNFADVPGLGEEEARGAALSSGQAIPPALENADALLLVLRAFEDPGVPHPRGSVDPGRDLADGRLDLILRDLSVVERRVERLDQLLQKKKDAEDAAELALLKRLQAVLEEGCPIRSQEMTAEERARLRGFGFLTDKPLLVVVNVGEDRLRAAGGPEGLPVEAEEEAPIVLCAKLEEELAQLAEEDRGAFLADYGLERAARDRVIRASFAMLGLHCFYTVGEDEVRAWPLRRGTTALRAAGGIHSDMERGFIRAEVVSFDDFMEAGSMAAARERGALRLEGKEYEVQEGDIMHIRFHV